MYEFLDRLICVALPRVRDFRGLSPNAFDHDGNYSLGLGDQTVFPEVDLDKMEFTQGMNITIVIRGDSAEQNRELLLALGVPIRAT